MARARVWTARGPAGLLIQSVLVSESCCSLGGRLPGSTSPCVPRGLGPAVRPVLRPGLALDLGPRHSQDLSPEP